MRKPEDPPIIDTNLMAKDIKRNYKNWKEATKEETDDYTRITSDGFFQLITDIVHTAVQLGQPLKR
eukprot:1925110-Ditylum_brightwellii.AAC.1